MENLSPKWPYYMVWSRSYFLACDPNAIFSENVFSILMLCFKLSISLRSAYPNLEKILLAKCYPIRWPSQSLDFTQWQRPLIKTPNEKLDICVKTRGGRDPDPEPEPDPYNFARIRIRKNNLRIRILFQIRILDPKHFSNFIKEQILLKFPRNFTFFNKISKLLQFFFSKSKN